MFRFRDSLFLRAIRFEKSVESLREFGRALREDAYLTVLIQGIGTEILAPDVVIGIVHKRRFRVDDGFFRGSRIDSFTPQECDRFGVGFHFPGVRHADGDRDSVRNFLREDGENVLVSEVLGVDENIFFGTPENRLYFLPAIEGGYDQIVGAHGYLASFEIREEDIFQCPQISHIFSDDVELPIAREARIAQVPGRYDVRIVDEEELGMDEIIELRGVVHDPDSRVFEYPESPAIDAGGTEYVLFEHDSYIDPSPLCIAQRFQDAFLGQDIDFDEDLLLRALDHRDEPIEHFFVGSRENLDCAILDLLDRKTLELFLCLHPLFVPFPVRFVVLPVLVRAGSEEEEGDRKKNGG